MAADTVFQSNETLFKSVDKNLAHEYVEWWKSASDAMLSLYEEVEQDGTQDAQRCRMIAAARLAQLGLCMFQFFGSAAEVIQGESKADATANNAVSAVVVDMAGRKIEGWLVAAKQSLN